MTLREILHAKGHVVHTIGSQATLDDVVRTLVQHNCGSLVVCDTDCEGRGMLGIITERDILRALAASKRPLADQKVADVMTTDVIFCAPGDSVEEAMGLMTTNRIRHLPVFEGGRLFGMVSIGDIVKSQHDQLTMENHYLKSYLHG